MALGTTETKITLFLLCLIYLVGELGHFLIGVVSRAAAQTIHYGDLACFPRTDLPDHTKVDFEFCEDGETEDLCLNLTEVDRGPSVCKWDYSGLGLEYQILAGPSFILVFTMTGIIWGLVADRFNRVFLLTAAATTFSCALIGAAFATKYWHLIVSRMLLAAGESGCSPLAAGMISDLFPSDRRAFAMSLFNWGIYLGYGLSYAIGNYIPAGGLFDEGWRASFFVSGIPGLIVAAIFFFVTKDPRKDSALKELESEMQKANEDDDHLEDNVNAASKDQLTPTREIQASSLYKVFTNPLIVLLGIGACVRHSAGLCWGYNSALYFQTYYPDYSEAGWWLMGISIGGGSIGAAVGGFVSDRLVKNYGIAARAVVLAMSQLLATPFSIGLLYLDPPYAFFSLLCGYMCAEMWFGVMFAILMELVPRSMRSTALAIALFIINNVGGNVPVLVHPVSSVSSYRTAITIFYTGSLFTSSCVFFILYLVLRRKGL